MKSSFAVLLVLVGVGCKPAPSPTNPTPTSVYLDLVEAGCLAPDDAGPSSIAEEEALGADAGFPWLDCLFDGGTVASCNVPCDASSMSLKKR